MQTIPNNPVTLVNTLATGAAIPATGVATGGWFYYISADGKTANIFAYDTGSTSGGTLHVAL